MQLEIIRRQFAKMRITIPFEIEAKIEESEKFTKELKRKLSPQLPYEKRLTLDQLR